MKMLVEIALPNMGELLVMMMTMISPSGREVPPTKSLRWREKVLLPGFRLETAALHAKSHLLVFELRRKGILNGVQTEYNFTMIFSWTRRHLGDLECK